MKRLQLYIMFLIFLWGWYRAVQWKGVTEAEWDRREEQDWKNRERPA